MKNRLLFSAIFFTVICTTNAVYAATYYVRLDGGTSQQCNGLADAAYSGSGTNQNCAFNHPNWAIAPQGNNPSKMVGGDTVIIDGSNGAQYMMGLGSPNSSDTSLCAPSWSYSCDLRSIPSGPDAAHPTRILGKGWDSGCKAPPQLWGTERLGRVLNLQGSNNVQVQCLEITDHSDCQEFGPKGCKRDLPNVGPWASTGIYAVDSTNVLLKNLNIHGMAFRAVHAGRLKDWTIEDTVMANNSFVGWDGDVGAGNSSNSGNIIFRRSKILYSGCGETYPGKQPFNCYSQDQGGYGDGIGTHQTAGNWIFEDSDISHNVSDGLDLLYHDGNGTITIQRSRFEGNAGNQVKVATSTTIDNSVIIGNCGYFQGQTFTWNPAGGPYFNNCRAGGASVVFSYPKVGIQSQITNSTITSNGDVLVLTGGGACNGSEKIVSRNNIIVGGPEFLNNGEDTADLFYNAGIGGNGDGPCAAVPFDNGYSIIWNTKRQSTACSSGTNLMCQDPKLVEPAVNYYKGSAYNANLQSTSPAINKALVIAGKSNLDYNSFNRGSQWDIGAIEYGSVSTTPPPPTPTPSPVCGNKLLEGSEQCDDGNLTNGDGCSSTCVKEAPKSVCGNKVLEGTEQCDDGNLTNGDGCSSTCVKEAPKPVCGNKVLEGTEQCDDGNLTNGDGCSSTCVKEVPKQTCGNKVVEGSEQCDDGNLTNGDGCSSVCMNESAPLPTGNIYEASKDFSGTQGARNWTYLDSTGKMLVYESTEEVWKGDETYLLIWDDGMHPGVNKDVVRRWSAHAAGSITITGLVGGGDPAGACGDGTNLSIKKNSTVLWQKAVADGAAESTFSVNSVTVVQGDKIDFIVNKGGTDYCDDTLFEPIITFSTITTPPAPVCGNKVVEGSEQCDDGNLTNGDGCSSSCQKEVVAPPPPPPTSSYGKTYYVRLDGGSATQCNGLYDAAYSGSGTNQNCAFNHPNWALAPEGNNPTKMVSGDTLIIDGSNGAQYMMGLGSPNNNDTNTCYSSWSYSCHLRPIPSGIDATKPTRILGKGWDKGCSAPPQLWGNERVASVLNFAGSNNVQVQCLEITDHSDCQEFGPNGCKRDLPGAGPWASTGIYAADSENVLLKNINIHGLGLRGVHAGRLKNWTIEDTVIANNSFVGWDGDIGAGQSSNSGDIIFRRSKILYSGCGETYPGKKPYNCYSQDQGGYGDGIGTHKTGGNWMFIDSDISHNVSDGLDLLYHDGTGTITIERSRFEGNAGNQVKTATNAKIGNSILISNCGFFKNNPITWQTSGFNNCRAGGSALALAFNPGNQVYIYNSTIMGNGDTIITSGGSACTGVEKIISRNNVYLGGTEFNDGSDISDVYYATGAGGNGDGPCGSLAFDDANSLFWDTKYLSDDCKGPQSKCADPKFEESPVEYYKGDAYNVNLRSDSPARGMGATLPDGSNLDYYGKPRQGTWDAGAIQFGSSR